MVRKILIVDDSKDFSMMLEYAFKQQVEEGEYVLYIADSAEQAITIVDEHKDIHLIVTDVSMPGMDGLTMLETINSTNPYIKSIVISGHSDIARIRRAMQVGASDYLIKPIAIDDLEESIFRAMSKVDVVREALRSRDRLKLLERDLVIAGEIQRSMLPQRFPLFPEKPEFDLYAGMMPAKEVGGDFYDFFLIDNDYLGFMIGDVTGKGIPAALLMALTRTLVRSYALQNKPASEVLSLVNNTLALDNKLAMFATTFFGILEISTGVLEYTNAAHVPPIILRKNASIEEVPYTGSMALGMLENMTYRTKQILLEPGDTLIAYTDGITDANNLHREMYGIERLLTNIPRSLGKPTQDLMIDIIEDVEQFCNGADQTDDIGVIVLRYVQTSSNFQQN